MRLDPKHPLAEAPRGKKRRTLTLALSVLFLLGWSGLLFGAGFAYQDFVMPSLRSLTGSTQLSEIVASLGDVPQRWLRARFDAVEVPRLHLAITHPSCRVGGASCARGLFSAKRHGTTANRQFV